MVVTLRTIRFNTEQFYIVPTLHVYVVYDSQKKNDFCFMQHYPTGSV